MFKNFIKYLIIH